MISPQTHTPINSSALISGSTNQQHKKTPAQVRTEEVQVVPQRPLQTKQWNNSGGVTPFYKKANFQHGQERRRTTAGQRSSFQRFVSSSNPQSSNSPACELSERLSTSCTYPSVTESGDRDTDEKENKLELSEIWKQARKKQLARIEAKKVGVKLKSYH